MLFKESGYASIIRSFQLDLEVAGLSKSTVSHYVRDVRRFLSWSQGFSSNPTQVNAYREYLYSISDQYSAKTIYEAQLALRRFIRFLFLEDLIVNDFSKRIKLTRYQVVPQPTYSLNEIRSILATCKTQTPVGARDYALIQTLFETGMRVGELISMPQPCWDTLLVTVKGKTGVRRVPITRSTLKVIDRYCRKWEVPGEKLWMGKYGPLTESGVDQLIRRRCNEANVVPKGVHAFRRASAIEMKRLGMNDSDIMEIMGWQDITMLRRYISSVKSELAQVSHSKYSPVLSL